MSLHTCIPCYYTVNIDRLNMFCISINRSLFVRFCCAPSYCFPRGEAVERSETDEERGRRCSLNFEVCTYSCVGRWNKHAVSTVSQCVSRIPHPPLRGTFPPGEGINVRSTLLQTPIYRSPSAPVGADTLGGPCRTDLIAKVKSSNNPCRGEHRSPVYLLPR